MKNNEPSATVIISSPPAVLYGKGQNMLKLFDYTV